MNYCCAFCWIPIVLGYNYIPKINLDHYGDDVKRNTFGDNFRVGDHFGVGMIPGAVQIREILVYFYDGIISDEEFVLLYNEI